MDRKEAIEVLRKYSPKDAELKEALETAVPELKESEDERIRNRIVDYLKQDIEEYPERKERIEDMLAWLEKQGEIQNKLINYRNYLVYQSEYWSKKEHDKTNSKIGTQDCIGHANAFISARAEFEEKFDYDSWNEKQGSQNLANSEKTCKDEPRFKVGDWLIRNDIVGVACYITQIHESYYLTNKHSFIHFGEEDKYRLWTIQDAKDGDVLSFNDGHGNDSIELIKSITDKKIEFWFCLTNGNRYEVFDGIIPYTNLVSRENATPATKEQRDTLFAKMHEAGYKWDAEKKELKKEEVDNLHNYLYGEQKPAWSEKNEAVLDALIRRLEGEDIYVSPHLAVECLKSLKERVLPQPKPSWSGDDEDALRVVTNIFEQHGVKLLCYPAFVHWLKTLPNRITFNPYWKPSDEQIISLDTAIAWCIGDKEKAALKSLLSDLKKLKG